MARFVQYDGKGRTVCRVLVVGKTVVSSMVVIGLEQLEYTLRSGEHVARIHTQRGTGRVMARVLDGAGGFWDVKIAGRP